MKLRRRERGAKMPEVAINKAEWQAFTGDTLDSAYRIGELISASKGRAVFRAESTSDGSPVILVVTDAETANVEALRRRYLEASFLRHENLLGVKHVARAEAHGHPLFYAALENADTTVAESYKKAKPDPDALRTVVLQAARALSYLHSENLVYCSLATESVWRAGDIWKLGDYSQLRLPGNADVRETRSLMTRDASAPPEAFEGHVSPAWDVWSLGWMLARLSAPDGPFDAIIGGCLEPKPGQRWSMDKVIEALERVNIDAFGREHEWVAESAPAQSAGQNEYPRETFVPAAHPVARISRDPDWRPDPLPQRPGRDTIVTEEPIQRNNWLRLLIFGLVGALVACIVWFIVLFVQEQRSSIPKDALKKAAPIQIPTAPASRAGQNSTGSADRSSGGSSQASASEAIRNLLDRWVSSMRNRDVDAQMSCYAPKLDQYFGWRNVSSDRLRREKQRQYSQIGEVREFGLSNVHIDQNGPDRATVSFDKTWDYGDRSRFAGSERGQFTVAKIGGEWRITSEKEGKVYWVKRGKR